MTNYDRDFMDVLLASHQCARFSPKPRVFVWLQQPSTGFQEQPRHLLKTSTGYRERRFLPSNSGLQERAAAIVASGLIGWLIMVEWS
jgi:hypothetical protein